MTRKYRTLLDIQKVGETTALALIPGWDPEQLVEFPLSDVPEDLRQEVKPEAILLAYVNLGADQASEIQPERFERAPTLPPDLEALR